VVVDRFAARLEALAQRKTKHEPQRLSDMLGDYVDTIQARMDGKIKPIATGFADLDKRLGGGFSRGTLIVAAGRPAMGKTALGSVPVAQRGGMGNVAVPVDGNGAR
jgi:replicative DNA helicase